MNAQSRSQKDLEQACTIIVDFNYKNQRYNVIYILQTWMRHFFPMDLNDSTSLIAFESSSVEKRTPKSKMPLEMQLQHVLPS